MYFDLFKKVDNNLKHETDLIIKHKEFLFEHILKLVDYCPNISMETLFMNTENSKTSEPHRSVLNFIEFQLITK